MYIRCVHLINNWVVRVENAAQSHNWGWADGGFYQQRKWSWLQFCLKAKPQLNNPVWVKL